MALTGEDKQWLDAQRVRIRKDGREYPARITSASENQKRLLVQLDPNPELPAPSPEPTAGGSAVTLMLAHEDARHYREILTGEVFEVIAAGEEP